MCFSQDKSFHVPGNTLLDLAQGITLDEINKISVKTKCGNKVDSKPKAFDIGFSSVE